MQQSPFYERILQQGVEQGIAQGVEQGKAEGRLEGKREAVLQLLQLQSQVHLSQNEDSHIRRFFVPQTSNSDAIQSVLLNGRHWVTVS